ncbi:MULTISPECIES: type IV pilin [Haloarcula]|uniref:type IV pilin n=1 Tax=Haloarcula TaxID=2237 RepID=UPI0023ECBDE0|nr:type IV pilin [Halomicroarcula sp. XH51]
MSGTQHSGPDDRATTAVVGVVLLVGLTVALVAVVGGAVGGLDVGALAPGPSVSHSTATFQTGPSAGCGENAVRVVHEGGDPIAPAAISLVVSLPARGASARIRGVPVAGTQLQDRHVVDDDHNIVYDNCVGGVIADGGRRWVAGTAIAVQLNGGGGTIAPGDPIEVAVVHEPTGNVVVEATLSAT